jgi:hypothetical protein
LAVLVLVLAPLPARGITIRCALVIGNNIGVDADGDTDEDGDTEADGNDDEYSGAVAK